MERSPRATGIANAATLSVSHTMATSPVPVRLCVWCKLQIARRNTYFINARNIVTVRPHSLSLSQSLVFVLLFRGEPRPSSVNFHSDLEKSHIAREPSQAPNGGRILEGSSEEMRCELISDVIVMKAPRTS